MDFTGLHINILARHTLNKNPSYAIGSWRSAMRSTSTLFRRPGRERKEAQATTKAERASYLAARTAAAEDPSGFVLHQ